MDFSVAEVLTTRIGNDVARVGLGTKSKVYALDAGNPPKGYTTAQILKAKKSREYHEKRKKYAKLKEDLDRHVDDVKSLLCGGEIGVDFGVDQLMTAVHACMGKIQEVLEVYQVS